MPLLASEAPPSPVVEPARSKQVCPLRFVFGRTGLCRDIVLELTPRC
jgi:hypothetical protein